MLLFTKEETKSNCMLMPLLKKIRNANTKEKARVMYLYWNCLDLWLELIILVKGLRKDILVIIFPIAYSTGFCIKLNNVIVPMYNKKNIKLNRRVYN